MTSTAVDLVKAVRLLVIDDNQGDYILTRELLHDVEDTRYEVDWASDGQAALKTMEAQEHDAYLLDHHLGALSGLDLLSEIKSRGMIRPIIMLTGLCDRSLDHHAMNAGACDYLVKGELTSALLERSIRYAIERNRLLTELESAANKDALTGLANRRNFQEFLDGAVARTHRGENRLGLLFIDLDHFKEVNDQLGHDIGDQLLVKVAERLSGCVRRGDLVSRLGGDEFAIILDAIGHPENATRVAQKILHTLATHPISVADEPISVGTSIGVAICPDDASDGAGLIKAADTAMYEAKKAGRNDYRCFQGHMQSQALRRAEIHRALGDALANQEFSLAYQPQVVATSGLIVGMEALLRWSRRGEQIGPAEFIPIAEDHGLIGPIGDWVLDTACKQYAAWQRRGLLPEGLILAVNVSAQQLDRGGLLESIERILEATGMRPSTLELEITETSTMRDADTAVEELRRINALGVRIALDDFGTGYSSLNHLKQLPIQTLKIDRSFVKDTLSEESSAVLVKGTLALARALGLTTVAEGVETQAQREFLIANRCGIMQGYLFHKPLSPAAFESLLIDESTASPRTAANAIP